jgi:nitric oxide reductase NorD protein
MSWDEALFKSGLRVWQGWRRRQSQRPEDLAAAQLAPLQPRLQLLAAALSGQRLSVQEAERHGGWRGDRLFLPKQIAVSVDPALHEQLYVWRTVWAVTQRKLALTVPVTLAEAGVRAATFAAVPQTIAYLQEHLPASLEPLQHWAGMEANPLLAEVLHAWLAGQPATTATLPLPLQDQLLQVLGCLMEPGQDEGSARPVGDAVSSESLARGTERKGKPKERTQLVTLRDDRADENPLVHVFEKVQTADDFVGGRRQLDGSDALDDHADALDELDLRQIIRTRERADSVYRSDAVLDAAAPDLLQDDLPATPFVYDEWDHRDRQYRKEWCAVYDQVARHVGPTQPALLALRAGLRQQQPLVKQLRGQLEALQTERRWRDRQLDGDELDLQAMVERFADLQSGTTPPDRLYAQPRRRESDLATLVLLDISLSADAWVENRRVLDVAREAVAVTAAAMGDAQLRLAIGAFYSNTRRDCHYLRVKDFDESFVVCPARLAGLVPTGYTRIGAALRHATALLAKTGARRQLLVLVSDGKPTDYDRYEGRYGVEDVQQAVREAKQGRVTVRALAVDRSAKPWLGQMFGTGGFELLAHPAQLGPALSKVLLAAAKAP